MQKEKIMSPEKGTEDKQQSPSKDDFPINRFDYTEKTIDSVENIKMMIAGGRAMCELKTSEKGVKQLTVYNVGTREKIFYTESPWQISEILEDVEVF